MVPIKRYTLDLREHDNCGTPCEELFEQALKKEDLWNEQSLYRAIVDTPKTRKSLTTHGTDHPEYDSIFALTHEEVFVAPQDVTLFRYAEAGEKGLIAVYNGIHLTDEDPQENLYPHQYCFKNPERKLEALVALFFIKWGTIDKDKVGKYLTP